LACYYGAEVARRHFDHSVATQETFELLSREAQRWLSIHDGPEGWHRAMLDNRGGHCVGRRPIVRDGEALREHRRFEDHHRPPTLDRGPDLRR
jgi:hypothetical protein